MKSLKKLAPICLLIFTLIVASAFGSSKVSAASSPAEGSWTGGTEVAINLDSNPKPYDWYDLLSNGVKVTTPGEICHPFRGGQYHWVADIRQLVNGKWVKVATTTAWQPNEEGTYMACAYASKIGTYALFGYYNGPAEAPVATTLPDCGYDFSGSSIEFNNTTASGKIVTYVSIFSRPAALSGLTLYYKVLSFTPTTSTITNMTGTFMTPKGAPTTLYAELFTSGDINSIQLQISTSSCSQIINPKKQY